MDCQAYAPHFLPCFFYRQYRPAHVTLYWEVGCDRGPTDNRYGNRDAGSFG